MTEHRRFTVQSGPEPARVQESWCPFCGQPYPAGTMIQRVRWGPDMRYDWGRPHVECVEHPPEGWERVDLPVQETLVEPESVSVLSAPPVIARPKIQIVSDSRLPYQVLDEFGSVRYSTSNLTRAKGVQEFLENLSDEDHNQ